MCASRPKVQPMPAPPPPTTPTSIDEDVKRESERERRRAAGRYGRQATLVTGGAESPVTTGKTLLGS